MSIKDLTEQQLVEELQNRGHCCHFCRYAKDTGSNEDGWKCTNKKWDSNFIKYGRDFCSDFEDIKVNIPLEYLEGV